MTPETTVPDKSVRDRVKTLITDQFMLPVNAVQDDSTLESLEFDSLDVVEIMMTLEEDFEIDISEDEELKLMEPGQTVSGLAAVVEKKLKK